MSDYPKHIRIEGMAGAVEVTSAEDEARWRGTAESEPEPEPEARSGKKKTAAVKSAE